MSPKLLNSLLLMGSFVLYYLVIGPLYSGEDTGVWVPEKSVTSLQDAIAQYDGTIDKVDALVKNAATLGKDYNAIVASTTRSNMEIMVPNKIDEVRLLSEVTTLANTSGVATKDIAVKDKNGAFPKYTISFAAKATYGQFKDFIKLYETSLRLYTLDSVSFKTVPGDDVMKFDVGLSTHYLK